LIIIQFSYNNLIAILSIEYEKQKYDTKNKKKENYFTGLSNHSCLKIDKILLFKLRKYCNRTQVKNKNAQLTASHAITQTMQSIEKITDREMSLMGSKNTDLKPQNDEVA